MRGEKQRCVNAHKPHTINIQYNPIRYLADEVLCCRPRFRSQYGYSLVRNYAQLWGRVHLRSLLFKTLQEQTVGFWFQDLCISLVWKLNWKFSKNKQKQDKKNPYYLRRFFHTSKEISRHFLVRLRIRHMREENQIFQPMFLSLVVPLSSSEPSPPRF